MKVDRFKKGDIVTYSNNVVKFINKPNKYEKYFDYDYYNSIYNLKIMKLQRYKKVFGIYILKTIYIRSDNK